ncbi:hypothetical protein [Falsiporphyromonas endometrii]|uniref:Chromosome partition protein Smc n=1 Tax=Falsiporphyromonas endometrii TaxID=1387297 RepID=A0ABV9K930_9PORP|nr:hypothetical protein [Porphyromonadaceae bacterium]
MNKNKIIIIISVAVAVIAVALGIIFWQKNKAINQERENYAKMEKEQMLDELYELNDEYNVQYNKLNGTMTEGQLKLSNDSIMQQLLSEKSKVEKLTQELNSVRSNDLKTISKLQAEVKTLRTILKSYVTQIDSLYATNQRLRTENDKVKADYRRVEAEAGRLKSETTQLTNKVSLAAKLNAVGISVSKLNKKGKATKKVSKITNLAVSFTIAKNVTASVGNKVIYIRIMLPTGEALGGGGMFDLEGSKVEASAQKAIEYTGEDMPITIYRSINEALPTGQYRVYIFADGNQIGQTTFSI